ncbi:MAG TPA: S53 family peptidase, partial [Bryobacteraceae bacterium]
MPQISADYRPLEGSERKPRLGAKRTGSADPDEILTVSVRIRRRSDAPQLPIPTTARRRRHLSREDFAARYGASQDDLASIAAFAAMNGLLVIESSIPRRTVVLKGSVAQMNRAFGVDLGLYETADEKYRGREGSVHLPAAIADIVEGVFGLDNRRMARPGLRIRAKSVDATSANATIPLTPPQMARLYNFPQRADGQTIGIFEFGGGYTSSDVQLFYESVGVAAPSISPVSVDGQTNSPGSDDSIETLLDIGVSGSAAPGARLVVYFAPWTEQGWVDVVTTAIHDAANRPSVISISYGWPENETYGDLTWSLAAIRAVNSTFQEAAALGITVFVSSGDTGSDCGVGDLKAHVEYPASDPFVTCCGGTTISNVAGSRFTEYVWNDNGVTGGGISDIFRLPNFALPLWQSLVPVPGSVNDGHNGRGIPDIAGNADPDSGYAIFLNGENIGPVGGTSAAAPLYAALAALLNAGLVEPVGYLNPILYAAPNYVFRDISDGQSNATGGANGYVSGPGWDGCTGLGSVDGIALKYLLQGGPDAVSPL